MTNFVKILFLNSLKWICLYTKHFNSCKQNLLEMFFENTFNTFISIYSPESKNEGDNAW